MCRSSWRIHNIIILWNKCNRFWLLWFYNLAQDFRIGNYDSVKVNINTDQGLCEATAKSLIKRDQEILGVTAERKGKTIQTKAKKAVILTCGGFENNQTMVRNYLPDMLYCYPMGTPYNAGDGITMAIDVGADLWHMDNIAGPYFDFKTPDIPVSTRIRVQGKSYIFVTRDASRFVAEAPTLI